MTDETLERKVLVYASPVHDKKETLSRDEALNIKVDDNGMTAWQIKRARIIDQWSNSPDDWIDEGSQSNIQTLKDAYRESKSLCIYAFLVPESLKFTKVSDPKFWQSVVYSDEEKNTILGEADFYSRANYWYRLFSLEETGIFELPASKIQLVGIYYRNLSLKEGDETAFLYRQIGDVSYESHCIFTNSLRRINADFNFCKDLEKEFKIQQQDLGTQLKVIKTDLKLHDTFAINQTFKRQLTFFAMQEKGVDTFYHFNTP